MGLLDWLTSPERTQQLQGIGNNIKGALSNLEQNRGLLYDAVAESRKYGLFADTPANNAYNEAVRNGVVNSIGPLSTSGKVAATAARDAYVGGHKAPMKGGGAPLHDLTQVYPDDIYSARAAQFYGDGNPSLDRGTFRKVAAYKGNPDAPVTMYRAVPDNVPADAAINNGDWVTINPDYAKIHGEGPLGGNYRVLQQQVPARKLFTNGDSIHEFGYDESGRITPEMLAILGLGTTAGLGGYGLISSRDNLGLGR